MKTLLKTSLGCLFIALLLNVAFTWAQDMTSKSIFGDDIPWFKMYSTKDPQEETFLPRSTVIYTSAQPDITKIGDKVWRIIFYDTANIP